MSEMAQEIYRTHTCGELTERNLNETIRLAGWVDTIRDHGGVAFLDLRDQYGVTQVVVHDDALLKDLHRETAITVSGKVGQPQNPDRTAGSAGRRVGGAGPMRAESAI
jgi:aspartyl-tRNA synthetase